MIFLAFWTTAPAISGHDAQKLPKIARKPIQPSRIILQCYERGESRGTESAKGESGGEVEG